MMTDAGSLAVRGLPVGSFGDAHGASRARMVEDVGSPVPRAAVTSAPADRAELLAQTTTIAACPSQRHHIECQYHSAPRSPS